jgi:hypothetical protein
MGTIMVDSDKAQESMSKTEEKAGKVGSKLGAGIKTAAKWGLALGAAAATVGAGMIALANKTGKAADRLLDLNSITGMSTDEIQKWKRATTVAGVSTEAMTNASQKLTKTLDAMSTGTEKSSESANKLGLSYDKLTKMSADERMNAVTKALMEVEDKTERARLGTDLLGGSWKEIAPIMDLGTEKLKDIKDNANIISEEDLIKANEFRIKMDQMKERAELFSQRLGVAVIPMLLKFFEWFETKLPFIESIANKVFKLLTVFLEGVGKIVETFVLPIFDLFADWWGTKGDSIKDKATEIFEIVREKLEIVWEFIEEYILPIFEDMWVWIEEHLPTIKEFFADTFERAKEVLEVVWDFVEKYFVPVLIKVLKWVRENLPTLQSIFENVFGIIAGAINLVFDTVELLFKKFEDFVEFIEPALATLEGIFSSAFGGILSIIEKVSGAFEGLIDWAGKAITALGNFGRAEKENKVDPTTDFGGARANGGPVMAGTSYLVGEKGPELFTANSTGYITPNDQIKSDTEQNRGSNMNVIVNVRSVSDATKELDFLNKKLAWGL